jgi:hypothetical protein
MPVPLKCSAVHQTIISGVIYFGCSSVSTNNTEQKVYHKVIKGEYNAVFVEQPYTIQELSHFLHICSSRYLTKFTRTVLEQQAPLPSISNF